MPSTKINPTILKFVALLGPLFTLMWLVGAAPFAQFITPPHSSAVDASEVVAWYTDNLTAVRIGCVLMIFSSMLYGIWGMVVTLYTRQVEGHRPILFYAQTVSLAACEVVVLIIGFFWAAASWRAGEVDPAITQVLHDLGWLGVLFTGAPFLAYMVALGTAILLDGSRSPAFPRWVGYFNLFISFWMFEACLLLFFKEGAFSQNGLMVFYVPMVVFFSWILTMTWMTLKAIGREKDELAAVAREHEGVSAMPDEPARVVV